MNETIKFRVLSAEEIRDFLPGFIADETGEKWPEDQFLWKYVEPPEENDVTVWIAYRDSGEIVAVTGTLVRHYFRDGVPYIAHQLSDSVVKSTAQRQGIYKKLMKYIVEEIEKTGSNFIFGFTNDKSSGALITLKDALELYGNTIMVLPIGGDYVLKRFLGKKVKGAGAVVSVLVKIFNRIRGIYRHSGQIKLELVKEIDEFPSSLCNQLSKRYYLFPDRRRKYLEWKVERAASSIVDNVNMFWFVDSDERVGYCVTCNDENENRLKILDLVYDPNKVTLEKCISAITSYAIREQFDIVMMIVSGDGYIRAFKKGGFFAAGRVRCSVIPLAEDAQKIAQLGGGFWYQAPIDRDNFSY